MAAFSFPENPSNGQVTTNATTGVNYVFQSLPAPGKWDVQLQNFDTNFVSTSGDTMTGTLNLYPTSEQPAGELNIKSATNANTDYAFKIRNSDSAIYLSANAEGNVTLSGKLTNIKPYTDPVSAFFNPSDAGSSAAGLQIRGPIVGNTSRNSRVLDCVYYGNDTPTRIRYFGAITGGNDLVNKAYVDTQDPLEGFILNEDGGSKTTDGNIIIKQGTSAGAAASGNLKITDSSDNVKVALGQGDIDLTGNLSFNSTSTNRNIQAYGATNPALKFLVGPNESTLFEQMSIDTNYVTINRLVNTTEANFQKDLLFSAGTVQTITLSKDTTLKIQPTISGGGADGNPTTGVFEIGVQNTSSAYVKPPNRINFDTQYETNIEATKIARMYLNNGSFYLYKGTGVTTPPVTNILTIFNRNGNAIEAWAPIRTSVYAGNAPGITISAERNTTSNWNSLKAGQLYFQTWADSANLSGGATGVKIGGGHSSPDFSLTFEPNNVTQYEVFSNTYSPAYGKRMYIYPDYSNPNLPDETPVNIGYLKQNGLVTTATYSSAAGAPDDEGDATTIFTQSSVIVPAQMTLDGRTTVGRGFTLKGATTSEPLNTSAVCLQLYYPGDGNGAAQLLYRGDTTTDNECVQTKASTLSLIQGHGNVFTATNKFHNKVEIGTSSTGQLVDIFNVLRVRANSNNDFSGFNNGAVYVNDKTGVTVAGLYDQGLYSTKKIIFNSNAGSQDIYLQGANRKGLNIKYDDGSLKQVIVATFDPDGSTLKSQLDLNLNKIVNVATATANADAANKLYVDNSITAAFSGDKSLENLTLTGTTALTINNATNNAGINFTSSQEVQSIKAYGNVSKTLKFFAGPTANDATQQLAISKGVLQIGASSHSQEITWNSSQQFQYFNMASGNVFVFKFGSTSSLQISSTGLNNCPRILLNNGVQIKNLGAPTAGSDAANKDYVDALKSTIHTAVNGAADFAALKAALLAALA